MHKVLRTFDFYIILIYIIYTILLLQNASIVVMQEHFGIEGFSEGGLVIYLTTVLLLFLSGIAVVLKNKKIKLPLTSIILLWLILISFSNFISLEIDRAISLSLQQYLWVTIFFFFYKLSVLGYSKIIINLFVTIMVFSMTFLVYKEIEMIRNFGLFGEMAQVNEIYFLVLMLPWIFLLNEGLWKKIRIVLAFVVFFMTVYSMKRTAIIGVSGFLLTYLYKYGNANTNKLKYFALIIVISSIAYYGFNTVNDMYGGHLSDRFSSISTDKGNGRDQIYTNVWRGILDFNIAELFIGRGRGSIKEVTGGYSAHNEFLEILYSWGLLGLILFITFIIKLYKRLCRFKKTNIYGLCFSSIVMYSILSLTTHIVIYPYLFCILASFWGYAMGIIHREK